ncbi:MAG TPA: serine protein kinase, partial [Gemmatales bacterium]|nr:serine protein kinase [Gemmatales bacterium]
MTTTARELLSTLQQSQDLTEYRKIHWEGSFEDYLDIVRQQPEVTRSAYQRLYDMIMSHGTEEYYENKDKLYRYKFFTEFAARHGDAI